jgi:Transglutaminase-like superfamily
MMTDRVMSYVIPGHVHFGFDRDAVVFMDLRNDRYSMLIGDRARQFASMLSPRAGSTSRTLCLHDPELLPGGAPAASLVSELLDYHLISDGDQGPHGPVSEVLQFPEQHLLELLPGSETAATPRDIWTFLASCSIASWRLKFRCIEHTVNRVALRNRLGISRHPMELARANRLVRIYNSLRPLFPRDFLCLFDSLALLEFLARHGCYANWIFAVRLNPWTAHCWVQYGTTSFNQDIDAARTYLPLLAV